MAKIKLLRKRKTRDKISSMRLKIAQINEDVKNGDFEAAEEKIKKFNSRLAASMKKIGDYLAAALDVLKSAWVLKEKRTIRYLNGAMQAINDLTKIVK